jgi:hypothetical protein
MRGPIALTLLLTACAPHGSDPAAGAPATTVAGGEQVDSVLVTLERTPCFGTCPVYSVWISGSGDVRFVGRRFTADTGEASASIPAARVDSLVAELRAGGYFDFDSAYVHGAPGCGRYATDLPSVITSVSTGAERKEIRHDHGCGEAPRALTGLERRIDEVAGTRQWIER